MDTVFLKLVNMSISASWVVLAVLILRLALKKVPRWMHCCLWLLVAVRLVCPVALESPFSLMNVDGAKETVDDMLDDYVGPSSIYWDHKEEYDAAVNSGIQPIYGGEGHYYVVTGETPTTEVAEVADYVAPVWVAGIAVMLGYTLISYWRLRKRVAASVTVSGNVYLCDYIDTPFILGIVKPKIYLPSAMDADSVSYVLAHERAHLKRKDHWWKPLGFLLLTIHWFNPVIWLAYVLLCRDIELACDEKVIREMGTDDKKAYSEALLSCSVPRHMIAACPLAFGEVGVKERVKSVLNYKKPTFWIILVAVIALIIAAVCFLTDPVGFHIGELAGVTDMSAYESVSLTAEGESMELNALQKASVQNFLNGAALEETPISQNRIERASDYGITLGQTTIWFDSYFSCIWVDDGVKPSFPYLLKDQEEARDFFNQMFGTEFTEPAPTEPMTEEISAKAYVKSVVNDFLSGKGAEYTQLMESDIALLEQLDWEAMVYTALFSGGGTEDYVFTVYEPTVIDGKVEEYYRLTFEIDQNGELIGFGKSGPERMAEDISLYDLCQLENETIEYFYATGIDFGSSIVDVNAIQRSITFLKQVKVAEVPLEMELDEMVSDFTIRTVNSKGEWVFGFYFDPVNGRVGVSQFQTEEIQAVYQVLNPEVVKEYYNVVGYEPNWDNLHQRAFPYHVGEDGTLISADASETDLYVYGNMVCYYDGTAYPGYYDLEDAEIVSLMGLLQDAPESAWEEGAHTENYEAFRSELMLSFSGVGYKLEARLFYMDDGVNLSFYRTEANDSAIQLEKTYHIRYEPLNEFMESLCDSARREGNIYIMYPDTVMEYTHEDVTVALQPMVGWEYEIVPYSDESTPFGIRCRPEWEEEGWIFVSCWPDGFATCGTGLETVDGQWGNGLYEITEGYFDGKENWSFIQLKNLPFVCVIQNEGADAWFERAHDISLMIVGSSGEGMLQPVDNSSANE